MTVPNLVDALAQGLRDWQADSTWDESVLHVTDLAVSIPPPDGKCPRQLWLRLQGARKVPPTPGQQLMFLQGFHLQDQAIRLITPYLGYHEFRPASGWETVMVEHPVSLPHGITGSADWLLRHKESEAKVVVDLKTLRGNAFRYQDLPKPAHTLQVQSYGMGLDADHGLLLYIDREGQNAAQQFTVERDDEAVMRGIEVACAIAKAEEPPPIMGPTLSIRKNKGPNAVYLKQPWQCSYCEYCDMSCPGALPNDYRDLGIVGYLVDGEFMPKDGCEHVTEIVEPLLREGVTP